MPWFKPFALLAVLASGAIINVAVSPQVYVARPPISNGVEIAQTWEWRSMAIREHSWWLSHYFPGVRVTNVAYKTPPQHPDGLEVGIEFASWRDEYLEISIDQSEPPLDISSYGVRDQLLVLGKVFSRIHCRDDQEMATRDSCFYFVAWDDNTLSSATPVFVAVRTHIDDDSEYALVEKQLLERLLGEALGNIPNLWTVDE